MEQDLIVQQKEMLSQIKIKEQAKKYRIQLLKLERV